MFLVISLGNSVKGFDGRSGEVHLCSLVIISLLISRLIKTQVSDPKFDASLEYLIDDTLDQCPSEWSMGTDGGLRFHGRLCVSDDPELKKNTSSEAHRSWYDIHSGDVKIYQDLKRSFW